MIRSYIPKGQAIAVADVLGTVAELRTASATATRLKRGQPGQWAIVAIEAQQRATAYVRELTERIQSRARLAEVDANALIRLAEAVLDGRMLLPEGVEAAEAA